MATEEENIELIDKYLRQEMTVAERTSFEKKLAADATLGKQLELQKDIAKGIEYHSLQNLKKSLRQTEATIGTPKPYKLYWKMVASFAIIAVVGYLVFSLTSTSEQEIFEKYYDVYPNVVNPVSRSATDVVRNDMRLYEAANYEEAINTFNQQLKSKPGNDTLIFYLAQSYLALDDVDKAITNLNRVDSTSVFYEPAQWYKALALLKQKKPEKAGQQLDEILKSQSSYSNKASKVKDAL